MSSTKLNLNPLDKLKKAESLMMEALKEIEPNNPLEKELEDKTYDLFDLIIKILNHTQNKIEERYSFKKRD